MNKIHGHWSGGKSSPTYNSWQKMKARCNNPNNNMYPYYGKRGITYDPSWESFTTFLLDMGSRPNGMTLDRIDNTLNYSFDNCRWATPTQQAQNKGVYTGNKAGVNGVVPRGNKWRAYIRVNKKLIHLGTYTTIDLAIAARNKAETDYSIKKGNQHTKALLESFKIQKQNYINSLRHDINN